ncbi:prepilin-type N-terminal cleavage/methylation domain-containing protein [Engelhardtia mirabilis]|uniref:Prepilin-type N-terminal cleavage/methylation domain-containing protein n=1 Tax=Engelhardtia mirabilis TaxID=2528011 RepID=A0A518BQ21_9BACT|nr:hypothetical protein Pla133_41880 [Planctomycetes bacterium Pla133]QDV03399.1 hypothetical protein Pla86_41870 [Planctomycetes bacterium Pla86]
MIQVDHHGSGARARAGVTLLELLLVMAIMAMIFGAGLGVFATANNDGALVESALRSGMRAAQTSAQLEGLPAALRVEAGGTALVLHTPRVRGSWHMERGFLDGDEVGPSTQPLGYRVGAPQSAPGFLGQGLDFQGTGGESAFVIPVHDSGEYDVTEGFSIGVAIRPTDDLDATIWRLGDVAGLEYERGGRLSAWLVPGVADDPSGRRRGGRVDLRLPPGSVPFDRWTRVDLLYDRFEFRVLVDGFPVGILPLGDALPQIKGPLVVGGKPRPLQGMVDELVFAVYERGEPLDLPHGTTWVGAIPSAARFEADGGLDRRIHGRELVWAVITADGEQHSIKVSAYGAIE